MINCRTSEHTRIEPRRSAERLSSVSSADAKSWRPQNLEDNEAEIAVTRGQVTRTDFDGELDRSFHRAINAPTGPWTTWCRSGIQIQLRNSRILSFLSYNGATAPNGPMPPHYREFVIALRHTTLGMTPLDE